MTMIERTLVLLKPDAVRKRLEDEIVGRYRGAGLKVVARKDVLPDREMADRHYAATDEQILGMGNKTLSAARDNDKYDDVLELFGTDDPRKIGEMLREWSLQFITSGEVVAMILEGEGAVALVRKLTGFTDPKKSEKGTIRGDLSDDSIMTANLEKRAVSNLVHASGTVEEAEREILLWFGPAGLKK